MEMFLCFVGLTFIINANAANRLGFPISIAPQDLFNSATLSTPASATTHVAEDNSPNPDIDFLAAVREGVEIGRKVFPSSHYPALIVGQWYENPGPKEFSRYPQLHLLFQAPGQNWSDRFAIKVQSQSYPTWGPPGPSQLFEFPYSLWNWTDFDIMMDLPEAWQRVQAAGWKQPLNRFLLEKGTLEPSGENMDTYDYYVFWASEAGAYYEWASIDTVTGQVSFHDV